MYKRQGEVVTVVDVGEVVTVVDVGEVVTVVDVGEVVTVVDVGDVDFVNKVEDMVVVNVDLRLVLSRVVVSIGDSVVVSIGVGIGVGVLIIGTTVCCGTTDDALAPLLDTDDTKVVVCPGTEADGRIVGSRMVFVPHAPRSCTIKDERPDTKIPIVIQM